MDILKLSQLGEGKSIEYKQNTLSLVSILKSAVAFANTAGGIILIGVTDDGEIIGIENPGKVQEQLANSIANRIKPQLIPDFTVINMDSKQVIALQIEHTQGPYYLSDKGLEKSVYIRMGNTNHLASKEVIDELKRMSRYASFDQTPCDQTNESDLNKDLIQTIYAKRDHINTEKLISLGLLIKKGKHVVATNGGIILFGSADSRKQYFPYAEVRCARFQGISRAEFIDRLNIEGGILSAIDEVPKFIRRNTRMAGKFGAMRRQDIPEYPADGVREALTNALVHANYEISGSRIFVAIYDDRLEIQNPGIMPPGMTIEQFKAGVSRIRNPVIARVFGELELVEEWGSGYKRIKNVCEKGGYPIPKWEEFGSALRVTFYPHIESIEQHQLGARSGTKLAPGWHQDKLPLELDPDTLKLLRFCHTEKTIQEMLQYMHWQDRTKFRRRFIFPLLKMKLLRMTLPNKPSSPKQQYVITDDGVNLLKNMNEEK